MYYTASGIVTLSRWPSGAQSVHGTATYRSLRGHVDELQTISPKNKTAVSNNVLLHAQPELTKSYKPLAKLPSLLHNREETKEAAIN